MFYIPNDNDFLPTQLGLKGSIDLKGWSGLKKMNDYSLRKINNLVCNTFILALWELI
jgi:hypothetical protein